MGFVAEAARHRETRGDTTPEPASQHLASATQHLASRHRGTSGVSVWHRRDWETQGGKRETRPRSQCHSIWPLTAETARHRETSGRHDPAASVTASHPTAEPASQHLTGRQAGNTTPELADPSQREMGNTTKQAGDTPEPASQHLASRRRETGGRQAPRPWRLGDKGRQAGDTTPEPASQHLASDRGDWETQGGKRETRPVTASETSGRHDPAAIVTASNSTAEPASQHLTGRQAGNTTPELADPSQREMGNTTKQAGDTPEPASQHLASRRRETGGRHDPSQRLRQAGDKTGASVTASGIRAQRLGDTGEKQGTTPESASQYLASDCRDSERQAPRPWRLGDKGRQAGDTTPEPASQHLASDRGDWETQGDKRGTRPQSQRHSIWHLTAETGRHREASGRPRPWSQRHTIWHLTGETGRHEDKRKTGPQNRRHTFPFSIPQVRTPMHRCLGNKNNNFQLPTLWFQLFRGCLGSFQNSHSLPMARIAGVKSCNFSAPESPGSRRPQSGSPPFGRSAVRKLPQGAMQKAAALPNVLAASLPNGSLKAAGNLDLELADSRPLACPIQKQFKRTPAEPRDQSKGKATGIRRQTPNLWPLLQHHFNM